MPSKTGINPITIRPQPPYDKTPSNQVTIGRLHITVGDKQLKTVQICVAPRDTDPDDDRFNLAEVRLCILDEDQFLDALGHLFPHGELARVHERPAN